VNVKPFAHPQCEKMLKPLIYVCHRHGCSLKGSTASTKNVVAWFASFYQEDCSQLSELWGSICGGNGVSVKAYAHPQPEKAIKHLMKV
jgi:hypothetical protein